MSAMSEDLLKLVMGVLIGLMFLASAGWKAWRHHRFAARLRALEAQPGCVACGHHEVVSLLPDVYLCPACGHEGGEGLAAWQEDRRRAHLLGLPVVERQRRARDALEEAQRHLTGLSRLPPLLRPPATGPDDQTSDRLALECIEASLRLLACLDDAHLLQRGAPSPLGRDAGGPTTLDTVRMVRSANDLLDQVTGPGAALLGELQEELRRSPGRAPAPTP